MLRCAQHDKMGVQHEMAVPSCWTLVRALPQLSPMLLSPGVILLSPMLLSPIVILSEAKDLIPTECESVLT